MKKKISLKLSWKKGVKADHTMQRSVSWILCKCLKKQKERLKTTITYEQKTTTTPCLLLIYQPTDDDWLIRWSKSERFTE